MLGIASEMKTLVPSRSNALTGYKNINLDGFQNIKNIARRTSHTAQELARRSFLVIETCVNIPGDQTLVMGR